MEYTHGVPRAAARTIITAGLLIAAVSASLAHQGRPLGQSGPGPERSGWPPAQTLVRYPAEIELPQDLLTQEGLRRSHPGVGEFLKRHPAWSATVDPYSGSIERAFGDGVPLEPGEAGEAEAARGFLRHHGALLAGGLDLSESSLVFNEDLSRPLAGAGTRIAHFDLRRDDIPVLGAGVTLGIRDGMVFYISTSSLRPVATSPVAKLTSGQAVERLEAHLERAGADPGPLSLQKEAQLAFYPTLEQHGVSRMMRYRLIWILNVKPEAAPFYLSHIAYVDAHDGDVLALFPEALNIGACVSDPGQTKGTVIGGIRPNRADDAEVLRQLPFAQVQVGNVKLSCDVNGHYPYVGGPASSQINGQFFRSHCDTCQTPAQPSAPADETGRIDFGVGGVSEMPVSGNGRSTAADRTAYYHLNQTRRLLGKWNNAFFDEIDTYVNILDFCNAFSSGYLLGFFTGDPACHNTGEIRNVVEHELGHTWDRFDGTGITSGSTSEWKGDVLALLSGGDSCVGESFFLTGGPTSACSGVRDIDEKAPGRTDHPLTPAVCPTCATLTRTVNGCGGGTHCQGEIIGQASWHLLNNLLTGTDYITGASLGAGNGALPVEQARWILERLLIGGGPPMVTFNPLAAGVSVYDALMLIDDEDGNLANGTPHAAYINAAFSHHELQEAPLIADAAACAPLSDPIVSAVVDRDAATGLPAVRLTWTPVGGATNFDVLRNERAGDAFFPIAQNVAAGPILDTGVQVGVTYRYLVAAVRKTGCAEVSPGANVATVAVVPPELRVFGHVFSEAPVGADGDGRIEPGERARVQVTLRETGGGSPATGVSALVTSDSPASPMTLGGPVGFGTVPSGGTAPGASAYEVFVGPSEPCGASIPLALSATGNEGCWQDRFSLPVAAAVDGCTITPSGFVEVVPGSVAVIASSGDGDGIPDNCETTTVQYQLRNSGSLASGPATGTASSSHPGVTFAPTPVCSVAGLNPGATALCQFSFSLGAASATGIEFTLTANSTANAVPAALDVVLGAETNPQVFSTLSYGFEGSLQGWTAQQFALSLTRSATGAQSMYSGSLTVPNICGKLTSPAILLDPAGSSTLTLKFWAAIEPFTDQWYDRANVHLVLLDTGQHVLLTPATGLAYNASGTPQGGICHIGEQNGWAGDLGGFNIVTFNLSAFAGRRVQIEVNYNSDEGDNREGFYVDDVSITSAASSTPPSDLQTDTCVVPEVSAQAAPVLLDVRVVPGNNYRFTWQDLGPGTQYNLYAGTIGLWYSHGAAPQICSGLGSGVTCDGATCTFNRPAASIPAGDVYFLTTATRSGLEGTAGTDSAGMERNPAQNTCVP